MSNYGEEEDVDNSTSSISDQSDAASDLCYWENAINEALLVPNTTTSATSSEKLFGDMPTVEDVRDDFYTSIPET